jgi:hypothetical protein
MSVIITKNKTVFYCNTCNNTLSGGNFVAMQQIIFNCGWVILPNKNCYCDKCAHKYNIIHEPKICVIEK